MNERLKHYLRNGFLPGFVAGATVAAAICIFIAALIRIAG